MTTHRAMKNPLSQMPLKVAENSLPTLSSTADASRRRTNHVVLSEWNTYFFGPRGIRITAEIRPTGRPNDDTPETLGPSATRQLSTKPPVPALQAQPRSYSPKARAQMRKRTAASRLYILQSRKSVVRPRVGARFWLRRGEEMWIC